MQKLHHLVIFKWHNYILKILQNVLCEVCGDVGWEELILHCNKCKNATRHQYVYKPFIYISYFYGCLSFISTTTKQNLLLSLFMLLWRIVLSHYTNIYFYTTILHHVVVCHHVVVTFSEHYTILPPSHKN